MTDAADLVVQFANRVARCPGGTSADLFTALRVPGSLETEYGAQTVLPPPLGTTRVRISGGVASLATVELWPADPLTLGDLDARLGGRQELPRVHWDDPHHSAYDFRVEDPPGRCTVFARSHGVTPDVLVESVLLRTEPAASARR